jgi:hypothetical protein
MDYWHHLNHAFTDTAKSAGKRIVKKVSGLQALEDWIVEHGEGPAKKALANLITNLNSPTYLLDKGIYSKEYLEKASAEWEEEHKKVLKRFPRLAS